MKEIKIDSSNIKAIFYDENKNQLLVFFQSKSFYVYFDVGVEIYQRLNSEKEKGKFFSENIRDKFRYKKIY